MTSFHRSHSSLSGSFELKRLLVGAAGLLLLVAVHAACGSDGSETSSGGCTKGDSKQCTCTNGATGSQVCENNAWGTCTCSGGQGGNASGQGGAGTGEGGGVTGEGGSDPTGPVVGDNCTGPDDCNASGLICVVENQGDVQGICTATCGGWTDCTQSKIGKAFWTCCDLANGTAGCISENLCPEEQRK